MCKLNYFLSSELDIHSRKFVNFLDIPQTFLFKLYFRRSV